MRDVIIVSMCVSVVDLFFLFAGFCWLDFLYSINKMLWSSVGWKCVASCALQDTVQVDASLVGLVVVLMVWIVVPVVLMLKGTVFGTHWITLLTTVVTASGCRRRRCTCTSGTAVIIVVAVLALLLVDALAQWNRSDPRVKVEFVEVNTGRDQRLFQGRCRHNDLA